MDFTATYISANSFSVPNDETAYFLANIALTINCNGTWQDTHVLSSSFGSGITTVVTTTSVLTNPCSTVYIGLHPHNLPLHSHDDDLSGGDDVEGSPPAHEWNDTQVRFRNPDGSWGSYTDLRGADWRFGEGPPSDSLGQDGDWYLDLGGAS